MRLTCQILSARTKSLIVILGLYLFSGVPLTALFAQQQASSTDSLAAQKKEKESLSKPGTKSTKQQKFSFKKHGAIVYHEGENFKLTLDVYQPKGEGPFPAILAVHGGAWRSGSKITMLRHAWKLASAGYVVVAINYRHAPKHKFPAQIHDMKHAVRWMRFHAKTYNLDPDRIAAFGYSAGGHLVSLLGTTNADDGLEGPIFDKRFEKISTRVQAVIAGGAPCEFSWISPERKLLGYWLGGSENEVPEVYRQASATTFVTADDPPFFFFHGDIDMIVPKSSPKILHDKLLQSGVVSEFHIDSGSGHVLTFSDVSWMNKVISFLEKEMPRRKTKTKTSVAPEQVHGNQNKAQIQLPTKERKDDSP